MKANELIGKNAVRTQPIYEVSQSFGLGMNTKTPLYNYTNSSVKILKATENHIVCEIENYGGGTQIKLLDVRYCDDNWVDYDELTRF